MTRKPFFVLYHQDASGVIVGTSYFYETIDEEQRCAITEHVPGSQVREPLCSPTALEVFVPAALA